MTDNHLKCLCRVHGGQSQVILFTVAPKFIQKTSAGRNVKGQVCVCVNLFELITAQAYSTALCPSV